MVAPITGMFKRRILKDITIALGGGTIGGYYFWYGTHLKMMKKRDDYYAKLEAKKMGF